MALIFPGYLDVVVALGAPSDDGTPQYNATGFLCGYLAHENSDGSRAYWVYLVTNRHVVQGRDKLLVRFNAPSNDSSWVYPIPLTQPDGTQFWTVHPESDIDVAAILVNPDRLKTDGVDLQTLITEDNALLLDQAKEVGVSEGDGVFVLGFPLGIVGEQRNYVIARQGIIARIQDSMNGYEKTFLIDASIFPGNSGGPVFTKPEAVAIQGTKSNTKSLFIGMVASYIPYQEVAISKQTNRPRMVFEENSGLGAVVPYDRILETLKVAVEKVFPGYSRSIPLP